MTHQTEPQPDHDIEKELLAEFAWDPRLQPNEIGVQVKDGVVTLTGWSDSYMKRWAADRAAYRVAGVRSVVNQIDVRPPGGQSGLTRRSLPQLQSPSNRALGTTRGPSMSRSSTAS